MNRTRLCWLLGGLGLLASGPLLADRSLSQVTITNNSNWAIHQLFLSPTSDNEWGKDQLGEHVIDANGGTFTLNRIPCDDYDVRLVDEDGDVCVVGGVGLCGDKDTWQITNDDLLSCQAKSAE
jgi:hypothetical protein